MPRAERNANERRRRAVALLYEALGLLLTDSMPAVDPEQGAAKDEDEAEDPMVTPVDPTKKRVGRPPGSKNKAVIRRLARGVPGEEL